MSNKSIKNIKNFTQQQQQQPRFVSNVDQDKMDLLFNKLDQNQ